eukprot:gene25716-33580_t
MGQQSSCSHMNIWALSTLTYSRVEEVENILQKFENEKNVLQREVAAKDFIMMQRTEEVLDSEQHQDVFLDLIEEQKLYNIHEDEFEYILKQQINDSDTKIFIDMFRLIDIRGSNIINMKDVIVAMMPLCCRSLKECFTYCFSVYDRSKSGVVDKQRMVHFLKVLNSACEYCGDRALNSVQIYDLVDSIYTSAGKIDGPLFYMSVVDSLATHPIVEMMLSPQFQGSMRKKVISTVEINELLKEM